MYYTNVEISPAVSKPIFATKSLSARDLFCSVLGDLEDLHALFANVPTLFSEISDHVPKFDGCR